MTDIGPQRAAPKCDAAIDAESLALMNDAEFMESFRRGVADLEAGRFIAWEDLRKELGL